MFHNIVKKTFVLLSIVIVESFNKMAPIITPIAAIVAGRINIRMHVCVVHIWTIPEFNKPQEDGSIHLLLLDEKVCQRFKFMLCFQHPEIRLMWSIHLLFVYVKIL